MLHPCLGSVVDRMIRAYCLYMMNLDEAIAGIDKLGTVLTRYLKEHPLPPGLDIAA